MQGAFEAAQKQIQWLHEGLIRPPPASKFANCHVGYAVVFWNIHQLLFGSNLVFFAPCWMNPLRCFWKEATSFPGTRNCKLRMIAVSTASIAAASIVEDKNSHAPGTVHNAFTHDLCVHVVFYSLSNLFAWRDLATCP
jgi:hypothetical protein